MTRAIDMPSFRWEFGYADVQMAAEKCFTFGLKEDSYENYER